MTTTALPFKKSYETEKLKIITFPYFTIMIGLCVYVFIDKLKQEG